MSESHVSFEGQALLAAPSMEDPNFRRSVIYMVRHTPEDAIGLVINQPTGITVRHVIKTVTETEVPCDDPLYRGGPVDGPLVLIHDQPDASDLEMTPEIFLSSEAHHIRKVLANPDATFRLIDGFSGWGPGQLEAEWATGCWLRVDVSRSDIFSDADDLWQRLIYRVGNEVIEPSKLKIRNPSRALWN
ncbi:MAG: YqgE/AlgH family protein [Pirellula sp.]